MTGKNPEMPARKLIEVAMPLVAMNQAGRDEKAVPRKGLPATMHLWWSRKPTGLARAVLFATIVDDPCDRPDLWPHEADRHAEHQRLQSLVADLARWDCPAERLQEARDVLAKQCGDELPAVVDPFCGGGAIPLEAVRLGLPAEAVDLNPVAALVTKCLVELPHRFAGRGPVHPGAGPLSDRANPAAGLAEDVSRYGDRLLAETRGRIGHCYPAVAGAVPVSYLWARTVVCSAGCGAVVPLVSTWWLCRRPTNQWHLQPVVQASGQMKLVVQPGPPPEHLIDPKAGKGASYRCSGCGEVTEADDVRARSQDEGLPLRLVAIQTLVDAERPWLGRAWVSPSAEQEQLGRFPLPPAGTCHGQELAHDLIDVPEGCGNARSFGFRTMADLLTPRQRGLLLALHDALGDLKPLIERDARHAGLPDDPAPLREGGEGAKAYAEAVTTYLALTISRMTNRTSTMTVHNRHNGSVEQSFVQAGYAFYGEFAEANPFSGSTGSFGNSLAHVVRAVAELPAGPGARVRCGSAATALRDPDVAPGARRTGIICTDPPYYDTFDYAALSGWFYASLRTGLGDIWPAETRWEAPPDTEQVVATPSSFGGDRAQAHAQFEERIRDTLAAFRSAHDADYPLTLYYAYQQTQRRPGGRGSNAWEALLSGLVDSGWQVVRAWPLRTERPEGVKTRANTLASSVLLVCRQRPPAASVAGRDELLAQLREALTEAVELFLDCNVQPVDLTQAAIGPGLAVFSSYREVRGPDGRALSVGDGLEAITNTLDEVMVAALPDPRTSPGWAVSHDLVALMRDGKGPEATELASQLSPDLVDQVKLLSYRLFLTADRQRRQQDAMAYNNLMRLCSALT